MFGVFLSIIINLPFFGDNFATIDSYDNALITLDHKYNLNNHDINDLNYLKRERYYNELELIKAKYNKDYNKQEIHKIAQPGDIYLTSSSVTFGLRHGHAAINSTREFETIESDNLRPVSRYPNNVNRYWKFVPNSRRYQVVGSTDQDSLNAAIIAEKQLGKPYCFNPLGDSCYFCTKLIWTAWDSTSAKNQIGHYYLAPDMMKSMSLKLAEVYMK